MKCQNGCEGIVPSGWDDYLLMRLGPIVLVGISVTLSTVIVFGGSTPIKMLNSVLSYLINVSLITVEQLLRDEADMDAFI